MSRGRRYTSEGKINMQKVLAVIMAIVIIILFVLVIMKLLTQSQNTKEKSFITAYYTIYEDGKWGVIDTKGKVIIPASYKEMIVIPDNSKDIFVVLEQVDYSQNTYKSKVINKQGKTIYTKYDMVEVIYNHDEENNLWYEENVLKVQKDGKYGLINIDGKEILKPEYDQIESVEGTKGVFLTIMNEKCGVVNNNGSIIIENNYAQISALTSKYENGFIVKDIESNKYGVIKYDKTVALDTKYDEIKHIYGNSMYVVKEADTLKIVNEQAKTILENGFSDIKYINSDNIIYVKDGKYGVVNSNGQDKISNIYDDLKYAFSDLFIAKKDGKYGVINSVGETKIEFTYTSMQYVETVDVIVAGKDNIESDLINRNLQVKVSGIVSEINAEKKYIKVRENDEYNYYNLKLEKKKSTEILTGNTLFLSKKDGKYGYINSKGIVIVDYIYDDATEQNKYGYVSVKKDGKWGSLDQNGKVIVEPKYKLTNNLVIDFINEYYLAEDINANYYTK